MDHVRADRRVVDVAASLAAADVLEQGEGEGVAHGVDEEVGDWVL